MSLITRSRTWLLLPAAIGLLAAGPSTAHAQARRGRPVFRASVVVIGGYRYLPYWYYDPWFQFGYPYPPYGYGYGYRYDDTSSIRLEVTPRQAQVFVDGYVAGTVDDFDGIFQRLRLHPGSHQIALYLQGYRTIVQNLYLNPGSDQKMQLTLEPLRPGETSDAPPTPEEQTPAPPPAQAQAPPQRPAPPPYRPMPRRPAPPPPDNSVTAEPTGPSGTLALRIQPGDAQVFVDGERWSTPAGQDRVAIVLSEGRHHVEVRKDGFSTYAEDVLIREGRTFTLNVSLLGAADAK